MKIIKERTRLMFTEYTELEERQLDDLVGTIDKVFAYKDPDYKVIAFPTGMEDRVKQLFPKVSIEDRSKTYWDYAAITPVEHNATPRNQLQIDFIKFVLENANNKKNVAGILSPGTGKAQPLSTKIPTPTPNGYTLMGDLNVGDYVFGSNGEPIKITEIYPQGKKDIYQITFSDGRISECAIDHLWNVYYRPFDSVQVTLSLEDIINDESPYEMSIPSITKAINYPYQHIDTDPFIFAKNIYSNLGYIPDEYMYNTIENRWKLLNGLLHEYRVIDYDLQEFLENMESEKVNYLLYINERLIKQIQELLYGLGYSSIKCDRNAISIFKNQNRLQIMDIQLVREEECQCIMVDSYDHLYLTEEYIVTHNTFMACYSAIKVGMRTLIIVPTSSIKKQWAETLINMFNVPEERVKMVNSPRDFINVKADFVIVSQASLAVLNKTYDLEKVMKHNKFGIKVIDEVQMWFHNIIKVDANSNIANNWYLTGTFGRSGDEENALYQQMFGNLEIFREKEKSPTLFNRKPGNVYGMKPHMHVKMMWTHSGLSKEEISSVSSTMRYSERAGKWMRYGISIPAYTKLVIPPDGTMTKFLKNVLTVVKMANEEVKYGKMLILSPTIESCNIILEYVSKMYPNKKIGTINSKNSKAENDRVKAECDILISTVKSAGTGFDVKDLSKLVVAEQFKSWILADQVSGRLRRRPDGKDTYMWDIVDAQVPQLRAWANERADVLRRKSKSFKVIDL